MTGCQAHPDADLDHRDAVELLSCQTRVLELLGTTAPLKVMLDCITAGLESLLPGSRCSILLLDSGALRHGSAPSLPAHYLSAIDGLVPGPDVGSCGSAVHLATPVVAVDIDTDARWDAFRAAASIAGLRSCWSTPILANAAAVIGSFAVYYTDPHQPTVREQRIVERLSYLTSVVVEHAAMIGALTESEERFRRAFEDNAVAMALLDTAGTFTRVNDALRRLTGLTGDELHRRRLVDIVAEPDRESLTARVEQVRAGHARSLLLETRIARPTGPDAAVSITMSLVRGGQGEPVQLSVNMLDITERIAAQEERRARHEAEVARRTAEAASQAKSQFLSAVSHEMRTPLQAITGFAELLGTIPMDGTRRDQALGHITAGATHLLGLVDDTLDLARIEAGALPLTLQAIPIDAVVAEVLEFLAPVASRHGARLHTGPTLGTVLADHRRLRQVLINLVSNGIRYSGSQGEVTVGATASGDTVRITVVDNGPGIAPALRARLFEPFFRPDTGSGSDPDARPAPGADGVGLGLMLARGLTEAMGGRLELGPAGTGGTVATISLQPTTASTHHRREHGMTAVNQETLAQSLIDTVGRVLGSQPGCRVTHEDGIVLTGTFTATPRARELTRAAHMQGDPVRVTVRFSNGFPDPTIVDAAEDNPRGMAVKFYLPDGSTTDLVCQDWPVFPAGTPEDFRDLIAAQGEGEEATEKFLAEHPDVAEAGAKVAAESGQPPLSWATMVFNSMNAFRLVNAHGDGRFARFRFFPERGEHSLPVEQRETADPHYLHKGVLAELPIRYRVLAQLAHDDDQTTDPSKAWPDDREWAELGDIEITGPDTERERGDDILVFDPMRVTDGVEPSDDPILHIRTHVYRESVRRRTGRS